MPERKDNTILYVALGLGGLALFGCLVVGCGIGGFFLFRLGPAASLRNANLSEANLATISNGMQTGMTLEQAEGIIGKGTIASPSDINFVNGRLGKFGNAIQPAPFGKTKYVWKNRGPSRTQWLFMDADNSTRRISSMTTYTGSN